MGISRDAEIIHKYISMGYSQQEIAEILDISSWEVNKAIKGNNFNQKYQGSYKDGQSRGAFPDATEEDVQHYLDNYAADGIPFEDYFYDNDDDDEEDDNYTDNSRQNSYSGGSNNSSSESRSRQVHHSRGGSFLESMDFGPAGVIFLIIFIIVAALYFLSTKVNIIGFLITGVVWLAIAFITIRTLIVIYQGITGYRRVYFMRIMIGGFLIYMGLNTHDVWGLFFTVIGILALYTCHD